MTDTIITAHVGDMVVAEDGILEKVKLVGLTLVMWDVVVEDAVHRMALAFEEECIDF